MQRNSGQMLSRFGRLRGRLHQSLGGSVLSKAASFPLHIKRTVPQNLTARSPAFGCWADCFRVEQVLEVSPGYNDSSD